MTIQANHVPPAGHSIFESWGRTAYRRRRLILIIALLVAGLGALWGTSIFGAVQTAGGFNAPDSQSQHEANLATQAFGRDAGDVVVLYSSQTLTTASPAFRSAVTSTLAALPHSRVESYASYWSTGSRQFVSASGHQTYAVIELAGSGDTARQDGYDAIKTQLSAPGLHSQVGGGIPTDETIDKQTTANIPRAEGLSFPILAILLLVIFGSLTAACMPLAIGALGILGSFTALRLLTLVTGVSVFSLNITTILGLGLGIDYGLFLVTRFREELHKQGTVEDAVARTVATAGRTVLVSAATVAIVLASLMLFPETILRSIGYGGVATVLVDMTAALTVLPALLAVLGPKVTPLRIRRSVQRPPAAENSGGWYRLAHSVMRRPVLYAIPIVVLLLGLGSPFLHVAWGGVDATALPSSAAPRIVTEALNRDFPGNPTAPIEAVVQFRGPVTGSPPPTAGLAPRPRRARAPRRHRCGGRADRRAGRRAIQHRPHPAVDGAGRRAGDVRAAVPRVRVAGATAGGDRGKHLVAVGNVRGGDVDLRRRAPVRAAELHPERHDQPDHPGPDVRDHVRALHGLRGVPAVADPRAVRRDRRQHRRDRQRPAAHRRCHHQRRAAAAHRHRHVLHLQHRLHQAARRGHDRGPHPRRDPGADAARARHDAAAWRRELVGARAAAAPGHQVRDPRGQR